ncbi:MAG: hypothetical protein JSV44_04615, partial [Candidatus Zixiibacteriota bacterium]
YFELWLTSLELVSRFSGWQEFAGDAVEWLWKQRNDDRLWDFGSRADFSLSHYFPLSENWRRKADRQNDWTTRVLLLIKKYYDVPVPYGT